jgi:tRNA(His) 5'-end guanylyltransferase
VKEREIFADLRTLAPIIIRLDGRAFHQFLAGLSLKKPFDDSFADAMTQVCTGLLTDSGISPVFAYTFSDEISIFLKELPFQGRVEKLTSVISSFAASSLTISMHLCAPIAFDARIIPIDERNIGQYLSWRQKEAWRNHINGYCQALLLEDGCTPVEVQRRLNKLKSKDLHEICFQHGVNLAQTPQWQRRGIMVYHTKVVKEGYNPKTGEKTLAVRNKIFIDKIIPLFGSEEGKVFLGKFQT